MERVRKLAEEHSSFAWFCCVLSGVLNVRESFSVAVTGEIQPTGYHVSSKQGMPSGFPVLSELQNNKPVLSLTQQCDSFTVGRVGAYIHYS